MVQPMTARHTEPKLPDGRRMVAFRKRQRPSVRLCWVDTRRIAEVGGARNGCSTGVVACKRTFGITNRSAREALILCGALRASPDDVRAAV